MSAPQIQESIQNPATQLINYPKDGTRKQGVQGGKYIFDFVSGVVHAPDGSTEQTNVTLGKIGQKFVKSIFITVSTVDVVIKIGNQILPKSHQLTYVVNGIAFDTMEIEFPTDRTPTNDFSMQVIASPSPIFPIDADALVGFHNPSSKTGTTTSSYVTIVDFLFTGFTQIQLIIENTHATNLMTADVQLSEDGSNWVSAQGYPLDINNLDFNIYQNSIAHKYIRVRLKTKTDPNHATYRVQSNLER